jgi:diphthamide biosynthesis protein 2
MDFTEDVVSQLRDRTGVSVLYHEIPTWVDPAPVPLPSTPDNDAKASTSSDGDSKIDEAAATIIYIGEESLTLTNLLMTHSSSRVSLVG